MVWTKGRFSFTYGKIEVVAKVPPMGTGIWPALWLQGNATYNWPGPGGNEIDFAELKTPGTPYEVKHALHYADTPNGPDLGANQGCKYVSPVDLSAGYHTYGVIWEPGPLTLTFTVDGQQTCQMSPTRQLLQHPHAHHHEHRGRRLLDRPSRRDRPVPPTVQDRRGLRLPGRKPRLTHPDVPSARPVIVLRRSVRGGGSPLR